MEFTEVDRVRKKADKLRDKISNFAKFDFDNLETDEIGRFDFQLPKKHIKLFYEALELKKLITNKEVKLKNEFMARMIEEEYDRLNKILIELDKRNPKFLEKRICQNGE